MTGKSYNQDGDDFDGGFSSILKTVPRVLLKETNRVSGG